MASYNASRSSTDNSSPWSNWSWDSRGFWVSSRYGPSGSLEYSYDYSETPAQTSKQDQATPRTPNTDYIKQPESLNFSYQGVDGASYATQGGQVQARYPASSSGLISSQSSTNYPPTVSSYGRSDGGYTTSTVPISSQVWTASGDSNATSQHGQTYGAADVADRLTSLNINTAISFQQPSMRALYRL